MKAIFILVIIAITAVSGFAQKIDSLTLDSLSPAVRAEVEAHLASAKKAQRRGNWFLIGAASLQVISLTVALTADDGAVSELAFYNLLLASTFAFVCIPFYHHAKMEREKARLLIYNNKQVFIAPGVSLPNSGSQGIRIVIPIGR
jgi:hypothetical protein